MILVSCRALPQLHGLTPIGSFGSGGRSCPARGAQRGLVPMQGHGDTAQNSHELQSIYWIVGPYLEDGHRTLYSDYVTGSAKLLVLLASQ